MGKAEQTRPGRGGARAAFDPGAARREWRAAVHRLRPSAKSQRQLFQPAQDNRAVLPFHVIRGQPDADIAAEQRFESDRRLQIGQPAAEARPHPVTEADMRLYVTAGNQETVRIGENRFVAVGGGEEQQHLFARANRTRRRFRPRR